MGWAGGAQIGEEFWNLVREYIPRERKKYIARAVIAILKAEDCDTIDEATNLVEAAELEE